MRSHLAPGRRAEQDDPLRLRNLYHPLDDVVQRTVVELRAPLASLTVTKALSAHAVFPQRCPTYCTASLTGSARVPLPTRR